GPDGVDEVPVDGAGGDAHVVAGAELALLEAPEQDAEDDQAAEDVEAVEAGHGEEGGGEGVGVEGHRVSRAGPYPGRRQLLDELVGLADLERDAEDDGHHPPDEEPPAVADLDGEVGDGAGGARA